MTIKYGACALHAG